jgi:hypothetical protein
MARLGPLTATKHRLKGPEGRLWWTISAAFLHAVYVRG